MNLLNLVKKSGRITPEDKIDERTLKSAWKFVTDLEAQGVEVNSALVWYIIQNFSQELKVKDFYSNTSEFEAILSNIVIRDQADSSILVSGSHLVKVLDGFGQWTREVLLTYLQQSFLGSRNFTQGLYDIVLNLALLEEINFRRANSQGMDLSNILKVLKNSSTNSYEFNQLNLGSLFAYI